MNRKRIGKQPRMALVLGALIIGAWVVGNGSGALAAGSALGGLRPQPGWIIDQTYSNLFQPSTTLLGGVDVSQWQGQINWDNLKSATSFAIIRSSFGCPDPGQTVGQYTDSQLGRNQSEARRVGILHGYYHFAYPDLNAPEPEADQFVNAVGPLTSGEILCLDFERDTSNPVDWCRRFLERVYSETGVRPLLYIDYSRATSYDWSPVINENFGLWLAKWDGNSDPNAVSTQWPVVAVKQWADNGNVGGISPIDLDTFNGDASQFTSYGYQVSTPPATVSFDESNANKWFGPADAGSRIVSWTIGSLNGGYWRQAWDHDPINDTGSPFTTGQGFLAFNYLDAQHIQGAHTAYIRTWNSDGSQSALYTSGQYLYDGVPPAVALTSNQSAGSTYTTPQTLTWQVTDPDSGVDSWAAAWDQDPGSGNPTTSIVMPAGTHTLHVHAWDKVGNNQDVTFGPFTYVTAPAAPSGLAATGSLGKVSLTWTASAGATGYNVYRGTSPGGEGATAYATGITSTSFDDTRVTNGDTYYYTVAAVNSAGASGPSNEASAKALLSVLHTFAAGLQMISAPTDDSGTSLAAAFGTGTVLATWLPSTNQYAVSPNSPADALRPGMGYWARFSSAASLLDVGIDTVGSQPYSVNLSAGWNMIGNPRSTAINASALTVALNGSTLSFADANKQGVIAGTLYTFQSGDSAYEVQSGATTALAPYAGYWLYAFKPCSLTFPPSP